MDAWKRLRPTLCSHCLQVLESMGFSSPTLVQKMTIPHFMSNKDVAVEAETGSGKTLAFVIPVVDAIMARHQAWRVGETGAVIITPTRELATQIAGVCRSFLPAERRVRLVIGGKDLEEDVTAINQQGSVVVVATPGRLLGLLSRDDCCLASHVQALEYLILDEADRLLEMGFRQSLMSILQYLPRQRRTGLFSATLTSDVAQLCKVGLRHPMNISVRKPGLTSGTVAMPSQLHCHYLVCEAEMRMSVLVALLTTLQKQKLIVFFATCASVGYFSTLFSRLCPDLVVMALHGRMHRKRQVVFDRFSAISRGVLMCTDVVARGADIPAVDWVLQFDPPSSSNLFVHRCGRTARMGQEGQALIFLTPSETCYVDFLRLNKGLALQPYSTPSAQCVREQARILIALDRELYQLSMRAFVSFVRFYYKHECKLLFQARALDLISHARGFALLRLPKMPELKAVDCTTFDVLPVPASDTSLREKGRERKHKVEKGSGIAMRVAIRKASSPDKRQKCKPRNGRKRKSPRQVYSDVDLEELAKDARLLKKFKNGRISEAELDRQLQIQ